MSRDNECLSKKEVTVQWRPVNEAETERAVVLAVSQPITELMECCLDVKQWCHLPHTGHDRCGEMDTVDKIGNQESDKDRALNKTSTAAGCACGMRTRSTVKMRIEQSLRNSRFGQMGYSVHFDDGLVLITFAHVATNTANVEYSRPSCPRWLHMNNMAVNHSGLSCSTMTAVLRIGQWIHCITSTTSALDNLNVSVSYKTEMGAWHYSILLWWGSNLQYTTEQSTVRGIQCMLTSSLQIDLQIDFFLFNDHKVFFSREDLSLSVSAEFQT